MKLLSVIFLLIMLLPFQGGSQNNFYLKLNLNPRSSWSDEEGAKVNITNSVSGMIGFEFFNRLSLETGIYINRIGYRLEKTYELIGVIDGFNSYLLEGQIPMKQDFTEQFIGFPLQINFKFLEINRFNLSVFSNCALNLYNKTNHRWWYFYQTPEEFQNNRTTIFRGRQKLIYSYEFGLMSEFKLKKGFSVLGGFNYLQTSQESSFPLVANDIQFYNVGAILSLKYKFKSNSDKRIED